MKSSQKFSVFVLFSFFQIITVVEGKTWALVTAGSSGWYNYRHQADACHAYQILHRNKIPDENIIVMMYDDIAANQDNPTPGKIINKPDGPDVYEGVVKDYTGDNVTPQNFLNVLQGNKEAMNGIGSGKVIDSGPDDDIFVYFTDHGAAGLIAFPEEAKPLTKKELLKALNLMHTKKKYGKMVIYIEACFAGSMFSGSSGLPKGIEIFATTAANAHESSYACYYDEKRGTYLGDLYSVSWMEDSDKSNLTTESLQNQFAHVKKRTNTSHVTEYGDQSISHDPVVDYQGEGSDSWLPAKETTEHVVEFDAVPGPEVPLAILTNRLKSAKSATKISEIKQKIHEIQKLDHTVKGTVHKIAQKASMSINQKIWAIGNKKPDVNNLDCHAEVVDAFWEKCYRFGKVEVALRYVYVLTNLCELGSIPTDRIVSAIETTCATQELESNTLI